MHAPARMRAGARDLEAVSCAPPQYGLSDLAPCGVVRAQKQNPETVRRATKRRSHANEAGCDQLRGRGTQYDAAYEAITVKVSIHVVLAVGHGQTWVGLKVASTGINLLEFSTQNGGREWHNSTQLVRI